MKRRERIKTLFSVILLALTCCTPIHADNTLRGKKLRSTSAAREAVMGKVKHSVALPDTLRAPLRDSVVVSGYDKPLRTYRETFLVTNAMGCPLEGLSLTITYYDMQGRQLHARTDTLHTAIPAGETRMLRLSTWDKQHSYYYHRGQHPRTANVTPYDVKCNVNFILIPSKP